MTASSPTIRIMLVDDHKTMLWGLEKLIEGERPAMALVGSASDAEQALALGASLRPDLIMLDLDLDGKSSLDILPALLAGSGARVIILSGNRDQALLARAVREGARGVVGKEAAADTVLAAIRKVHGGELWLDQAVMGRLLGELIGPKAAPPVNPEAARLASLTEKERKIIRMVVDGNGAANKELAQRAFIAEATLRNYLTSIYQKLAVANRLELYVYATKHGLGDAP
ncbi:response regulator transcription factor [Rugamonas sp.]|uniref:response regulator n=1 Tax=Rugamonas sp. TaxID=1926287 RepID=UPI0025FD73CE|nr:response regulator transcription factor [Rugamonas sp.]